MSALKIEETKVKRRPLNPDKDLNFVLSSWLQSYRNSMFARHIPNDVYFSGHQMLLGQILKHKSNSVTVLCDAEDEDQILGYAVYSTDSPLLFYIYVKAPFRKFGMGRYLLEGIRQHYKEITKEENPTISCTHKSRRWPNTAKKFGLVYNPYIIGT